jgi:hypothetical protein
VGSLRIEFSCPTESNAAWTFAQAPWAADGDGLAAVVAGTLVGLPARVPLTLLSPPLDPLLEQAANPAAAASRARVIRIRTSSPSLTKRS